MIPRSVNLVNVADTCAIWNVVGSRVFFRMARQGQLSFVITDTVSYECFIKSRGKTPSLQRERLRDHLRKHIQKGEVSRVNLSIDDLQELIAVARQNDSYRRLGCGEISCAAVARRLRHAVLTDNKRDFRAIDELVDGLLQTTPRLLGWLYLVGHLTDGDVDEIIAQHCDSGGQMAAVYERAHREACELRLVEQSKG